jgi:hypothetical protein
VEWLGLRHFVTVAIILSFVLLLSSSGQKSFIARNTLFTTGESGFDQWGLLDVATNPWSHPQWFLIIICILRMYLDISVVTIGYCRSSYCRAFMRKSYSTAAMRTRRSEFAYTSVDPTVLTLLAR